MVKEGSAVTTRNAGSKAQTGTPNQNIKSTDELYIAVGAIRESVAAILSSQDSLVKKFDELSNRQLHIEQENKVLHKEVTSLHEKVNSLQLEQAKMHQQLYKNVITITGVPYQKEEDVFEIVRTITSLLGIQIENYNIECCRRLKSATNNITQAVYVEFTSNKLKNDIIQKYKANGPILLEQYLPSGNIPKPLMPTSKIIVNNFISNFTLHLLSESRQLKEKYNIKYVWQRNGVIHIKKSDKSKVYFIKTFEELENIDK